MFSNVVVFENIPSGEDVIIKSSYGHFDLEYGFLYIDRFSDSH